MDKLVEKKRAQVELSEKLDWEKAEKKNKKLIKEDTSQCDEMDENPGTKKPKAVVEGRRAQDKLDASEEKLSEGKEEEERRKMRQTFKKQGPKRRKLLKRKLLAATMVIKTES